MPAPVIPFNRTIELASSFGIDETTLGPPFRAQAILDSERYRLLDRRGAYYNCSVHDWKTFDFDGRLIQQGNPLLGQPLLASQPADWYVPLRMRRPSAPYRLPRAIVDAFTNLIFGYQRWPSIGAPGDPETESFVRAVVDATRLRTLMIRARSVGGSTGTVGLSWRISNGVPRIRVHSPKHLYVQAWADRELLVPSHVIEIYKFPRDEWDHERRQFMRNWYWFRHDWTPLADVAFQEVKADLAEEPQWIIDEENTYKHDDGFAHFVWIQNLPTDTEDFDGVPDYEGLYENFESLDLLNSVMVRGTTLNLDPTLILKLDPAIVQMGGVKKGSDNSLVVGQSGDAHYMELQGSSGQVGATLLQKMRENALEVAQCVIPDPNQIGAAGTSSVALKVIYAPMLGKADVLREQYEQGMRDLLSQILRSARRQMDAAVTFVREDGVEEEIEAYIDLPPRIVHEEVLDEETGEPTGETRERLVPLRPGDRDDLTFDWGDYFLPTPSDQQQTASTLNTLVTAKLVSQESGADLAARVVRIDPRADWRRIQGEKEAEAAEQEGMTGGSEFGGFGGRVDDEDELPPGALPRSGRGVGDLDVGSVGLGTITVDEARGAMGLEPLGGELGGLTLTDFQARARAKERLAVEGLKAEAAAERERARRGE